MKKICLLSCEKPLDFFATGMAVAVTEFAEDELLRKAFVDSGVVADRVAWDAKGMDWAKYEAVIVKSTWDYYVRCDEFLDVLDGIARKTTVLNSPASIRWNADKKYLFELAAKGLPVVPTHLIEEITATAPAEVAKQRGWEKYVVKPTVGGGALATLRFPEDAGRESELLNAHMKEFIVQPFIPSVVTEGEFSFLFYNKKFQYASLKRSAAGDYRVQGVHGGTYRMVDPSTADLSDAQRALDAIPYDTLLARIDLVRGDDGRLLLMEAEIIEPYLWLRESETGAQVLVSAYRSHAK